MKTTRKEAHIMTYLIEGETGQWEVVVGLKAHGDR